MSDFDPTSELPLAPRDLLILAVLADGPLHGYGIVKAVEDRSESGIRMDPANLYRVLRRMRSSEWVDEIEDSTAERRRTHGITPRGEAVLRAEIRRLQRLVKHASPVTS